jgi:hypothetical protein
MFLKVSLIAAFGFLLMGAVNPASASEGAEPIAMPAVRTLSSATSAALGARDRAGIVIAEAEQSNDSAESDSDSDSNDPDDQAENSDQDRQDQQDQMDQQNAGNQNQYGAQGYQPPNAGEIQQNPFPQAVNPYQANPYQANPYQ